MPQEIKSFFKRILDLRDGAEAKAQIIENVKDDADISSARFWTLVFAIGVASVGLNINSIPVVIGAMLISPLMGPLVSMGLALSINDWGLLRRSSRNLLVLVTISIIISTLYFALTPITSAQSELLSRIRPTIFDVLIAVFGGIAGFIAVSRARHNNAIPGVAIATALMPPLCTVGYGIGTWQPQFIFGAFYLFLINSIFICLSALLVAKYMKLPKKEYPDAEKKKRVRQIITAIILVITAPAIFLAYTFVSQSNFSNNAERYILETFKNEGYTVVYENATFATKPPKIELAILNERFSPEQIEEFTLRLKNFDLAGTELVIKQNGFALSKEEWQKILNETEAGDQRLRQLEQKLEEKQRAFSSSARILMELKTLYPGIVNLTIANIDIDGDEVEKVEQKSGVIAVVYEDINVESLNEKEKQQIEAWLQIRLDNKVVKTYFEEEKTIKNEVGGA